MILEYLYNDQMYVKLSMTPFLRQVRERMTMYSSLRFGLYAGVPLSS
jgi:hypothetical protein